LIADNLIGGFVELLHFQCVKTIMLS